MLPPTREQIEADVIRPTISVEYYNGTSWVDVSSMVVQTRVQTQLPSALDLGAGPIPTATVTLTDQAVWHRPAFAPIRIAYGLASTSTIRRFVGYVTSRTRSHPSASGVTWSCEGVAAAIAAQTIRVAVRRNRPAHTETTATSIEDVNHPSYAAGMINEVLWRAGGRPYRQRSVYPNAPWYYHCTPALLTPEWTWLDGENAWEDMARLCRAVGSIIYQDEDGIVRVKNVVYAASFFPTYGWTSQPLDALSRTMSNFGVYTTAEELSDWRDVLTSVTVRYIRRGVTGVIECYRDTTVRYVAPNQSIQLTLDATDPIVRLDRIEIDAASAITSTSVTLPVSELSVVAHTIEATVTNPTAEPVVITAIRAYGAVVEAIEEGSVTASCPPSTITPRELRTEDNPYIQNELHARGLARLLTDLYGIPRPRVILRRCTSDPDRGVGEIVLLYIEPLGILNVRYAIEQITNDSNAWMDVTLVQLGWLPTNYDFHFVDLEISDDYVASIGY